MMYLNVLEFGTSNGLCSINDPIYRPHFNEQQRKFERAYVRTLKQYPTRHGIRTAKLSEVGQWLKKPKRIQRKLKKVLESSGEFALINGTVHTPKEHLSAVSFVAKH